MESRIDLTTKGQGALTAILGLAKYLAKSTVEQKLLHLIELRASQINGCAFCIDMHSKDLRHEGDTEQRLYLLDAWRESPFYTDRERAALALTEAVTLIAEGHVPDEVFDEARKQFSEDELIDLTLAISAVNSWNRLNITFRTPAGMYQPGQYATMTS